MLQLLLLLLLLVAVATSGRIQPCGAHVMGHCSAAHGANAHDTLTQRRLVVHISVTRLIVIFIVDLIELRNKPLIDESFLKLPNYLFNVKQVIRL